jgi:cytochrome c oxidase cbb3-type subunit 3
MSDNKKDPKKGPQKDKLLDHNYDDIQELDNPLPAWWVWLFYATIVFSVIYFIYFTFMLPSSAERIDAKINKMKERPAEVSTAVVPAEKENLPDTGFPSDPDSISLGKGVYVSKCLACHTADGGGLVGPNLTDKYWIHGKGTDENIYEVILNGVPEKGMISWKPLLSDKEIRAVTAYIKTLQGTTPANPKAPEGELVE